SSEGRSGMVVVDGTAFTMPTSYMNDAYFMVFSGTRVHLTCGPPMTSNTSSGGSFDFESSIHNVAAARLSALRISVASASAAINARKSFGLSSWNLDDVQAT